MVTRIAIARQLGVSHTCVSQVLNNSPKARIPEATRQRILKAAHDMGYVPRPFPRGQARSTLVAYVLCSPKPLTHGYWHFAMLHELQRIALADDRSVTFLAVANDAQSIRSALRAIDATRPIGVVLDGIVPEALVTAIQQRQLPLVVAGVTPFACSPQWSGRVSTVSMDVSEVVRQLLRVLYTRGSRQIAFVCGPTRDLVHQRLLQAFQEELLALGLPCNPALIQIGEDESAIEIFTRYEDLGVSFDGLLVATSAMATAITTYIRSSRRAYLDESRVAFVGHIESVPPSIQGITSCGCRCLAFCQAAYEQLFDLLNYGPHKQQHILVPCELHEGLR